MSLLVGLGSKLSGWAAEDEDEKLQYLSEGAVAATADYVSALASESSYRINKAEGRLDSMIEKYNSAVESPSDDISAKYDLEGQEGSFVSEVVDRMLDGSLDQGTSVDARLLEPSKS
jgi:hypothetical protein